MASLPQSPPSLQFLHHFYGENERYRTERSDLTCYDLERSIMSLILFHHLFRSCWFNCIRYASVARLLHTLWFVPHRLTSPTTLLYMSLCVVVIRYASFCIEVVLLLLTTEPPLPDRNILRMSLWLVSIHSSKVGRFIRYFPPSFAERRTSSRQDRGNPLYLALKSCQCGLLYNISLGGIQLKHSASYCCDTYSFLSQELIYKCLMDDRLRLSCTARNILRNWLINMDKIVQFQTQICLNILHDFMNGAWHWRNLLH